MGGEFYTYLDIFHSVLSIRKTKGTFRSTAHPPSRGTHAQNIFPWLITGVKNSERVLKNITLFIENRTYKKKDHGLFFFRDLSWC